MTRRARRGDPEGKRAAPLELFYDLVFVFAISQVSHLLLEHLTVAGAGRAVMILLAVWWSWNYTTWATNELDSETDAVRVLLIALMLASLLMAIAAPEAFGSKGLLFAGAYVSIQVGRHLFLTFVVAAKGTIERERAGRILIWLSVAGVFWIAGGIADDAARVGLWTVALALDYSAPLFFFRVPGRPRLAGETWDLATDHFVERFGLFVIAALGETIVLTGTTVADLPLDVVTVTAFGGAFVGTAALWWLYFTSTRELGQNALTESSSRTQLARDSYTYGHVLIIAGVILTAVGDELVIAHPSDRLLPAQMIAVVGGPALYLVAQTALRLRATRTVSGLLVGGALACVAIGVVGAPLPGVAVSALLVIVLVGVVVTQEVQRKRPTQDVRHSTAGARQVVGGWHAE
ncbi:low temperature requirement protein A [Rhodococcus sp. SGAir0479]|uniref:low temperature requirement protein A n=1 Tax=Rhodococcus sp. SGAir0479 TaxID=2567884 RepID=UPI0010CD1D6F|nr:low temperature requirement protein A [Rhodococcus sp. SGAir0479]QCQ91151.1 low temperature requirement protein A [Rhodococcus sp. SGAir0479]